MVPLLCRALLPIAPDGFRGLTLVVMSEMVPIISQHLVSQHMASMRKFNRFKNIVNFN
jgi:hypothetical protein